MRQTFISLSCDSPSCPGLIGQLPSVKDQFLSFSLLCCLGQLAASSYLRWLLCASTRAFQPTRRARSPGSCNITSLPRPLARTGHMIDPQSSNIAAQPLQAPALSQKHPCTIRGGGGIRQLHECCALAVHALGQLKPYHSV